MDIRQLRYFLAVAETGHMTRAAEQLGMAQPPLSQQIKALEGNVGLPLFKRHAKGVTLTEAGRALQADATRLVHDFDALHSRMQLLAEGKTGRLSIAFTSSAAAHEFTPFALCECRARHPDLGPAHAACLVLVVGALPGALDGAPHYTDIARARSEVFDGIAASLEYARQVGMPLAIEPLHPMQAADRACINTLEHALDICDALDPQKTGALGVALDVYHVWWDPKLAQQIARAGQERLLAFHVCDWRLPTRDLLSDRGMMGDGVIELKKIRQWVEDAGFAGYAEVEIFSALDWWQRTGEETLDTCIARHHSAV